jgi:hypothetical protein
MGKNSNCAGIWLGNLKEIEIGDRGKRDDNIKMGITEVGWNGCSGFIWFKIGISIGMLWIR